MNSLLPKLAPLLAISVGLAVNLLAVDMAAQVFMLVLALVLFPGWVGMLQSIQMFIFILFEDIGTPNDCWTLFPP